MPVKKLMLSVGPLNAMPVTSKLEAIKFASHIAKFVPNPTVQAVAHTVDYGIEAVEKHKDLKTERELIEAMSLKTSFSPK